jgi:hypothetical protein
MSGDYVWLDEISNWEPEDAPIEVQIEAWLNEVRPEGRRHHHHHDLAVLAGEIFVSAHLLQDLATKDPVYQALLAAWGGSRNGRPS